MTTRIVSIFAVTVVLTAVHGLPNYFCPKCRDPGIEQVLEPYNDPTGIRILINKSWGPCEEGTIEWEISHDGCHLTNVTVGDRHYLVMGPAQYLRTFHGWEMRMVGYKDGTLTFQEPNSSVRIKSWICRFHTCFEDRIPPKKTPSTTTMEPMFNETEPATATSKEPSTSVPTTTSTPEPPQTQPAEKSKDEVGVVSYHSPECLIWKLIALLSLLIIGCMISIHAIQSLNSIDKTILLSNYSSGSRSPV